MDPFFIGEFEKLKNFSIFVRDKSYQILKIDEQTLKKAGLSQRILEGEEDK